MILQHHTPTFYYRRNLMMNNAQLEIDVALKLHKLSPAQIRQFLLKVDRNFDCASGSGLKLTGIVTTRSGAKHLMFEGGIAQREYYTIEELSAEDKAYLLEILS